MCNTTGEKLSMKMKEKGISKKRLAKETGMDYSTVCRLCNGDRVGYLDTWMKVCDAIQIEMNDIVR